MKEHIIEEILGRHNIQYVKHGSIWATIIPSVGAHQNKLGNIMHTMKDHILHINSLGIVILAIDDNNGLPKEETLLFIPRTDILSSDIKTKLSKFIFTLNTEKGTFRYKIRKSILGCPWHKENLSFLLLGSGVSSC